MKLQPSSFPSSSNISLTSALSSLAVLRLEPSEDYAECPTTIGGFVSIHMDKFGGLGGQNTMSKTARRRRSNLNRRPSNESGSPQGYYDSVSLSSTPSDLVSNAPSEANAKELTLNQSISRASSSNLADAEILLKSSDEDGVFGESNEFNQSGEDNPAAASWKSVNMKDNKRGEIAIGSHHYGQPGAAYDAIGSENKVTKVKLKVGGVTRTIHTGSSFDGSSVDGTSARSDAICPSHKENLDGEKGGMCGVPWKDFSKIGFSFRKVDSSRLDIMEESVKQALKHGRSHKNKSAVKKYVSDEGYDDEDDDEIRYLQNLKTWKLAASSNIEYEDDTKGKKLRKLSRVMDRNTYGCETGIGGYDSTNPDKLSKKSQLTRAFDEPDYIEEEESVSDGDIELKNKQQKKESTDVLKFSKAECSITTRRRAIQMGRHISPGLGADLIQLPNGLQPAQARKQKEQLSEVEQQLKRAEAAKRRRMQNEKAALESQAEAIRKILGQDSSKKKREEKIKKQQEHLAKERTANAATVASNVVRWVIGPLGTVVTFPAEVGLPSIFEPKPCSYPPPREKCAGPSCSNVYRYRDSKSNLPLCSLQCYKAIHKKIPPLTAC